jgi:hypothetical protein
VPNEAEADRIAAGVIRLQLKGLARSGFRDRIN